MEVLPITIEEIPTIEKDIADDFFILAASWEQRCLGAAQRFGQYKCTTVAMIEYDGVNVQREENIKTLTPLLEKVGQLEPIMAEHDVPILNVRKIVSMIQSQTHGRMPRLTIDISTFTRKHLLQLIQGLDMASLLGNCQFLYTEPQDYPTEDNEPISHGISSVEAVPTLTGVNYASQDTVLVLFLGYEGRRALALYEHLEPNITIAIIPRPPYHPQWIGRTEAQNKFLLSSIPRENVYYTHSLNPTDTETFLTNLVKGERLNAATYNFMIAPMGTKAQTLGIYRFWRKNSQLATIMYASPVGYKEKKHPYAPGRTWLVDHTREWK